MSNLSELYQTLPKIKNSIADKGKQANKNMHYKVLFQKTYDVEEEDVPQDEWFNYNNI